MRGSVEICDKCGKQIPFMMTVVHSELPGKKFCSVECGNRSFDSKTTPSYAEEQLAHYITKDSGKREQFATGAKRDTRKGKGRYDLIPPKALRRVAGVYERGAEKYGDHNWEKGMPYSRFLDSALRHICTWAENERDGARQDEDHLAQAIFNLMAIIHFEETKPEMNDIAKRT